MASTKETTPTPSFPVTVAPTYFSTRAFALHSIAISYALSWPPHVYLFGKLMKASNYAYSNIVPRVQLETLTPNLPKATTDMLWRARGCHLNTLETFPLFAAAMFAGTYTKVDTKDLNFCAAEYLAARVLYSVLYMTVQSEKASYLRSAAYFWSVGIPFYVLWKAGKKVAESEREGREKL